MNKLKSKSNKRRLYEKFNIYLYINVPLISLVFYGIIRYCTSFSLKKIVTFNNSKIEIFIAIAGILLTIMGLFISLPGNEFRKLMKKYGHDKIIMRILFIGILSSLLGLILAISELFINLQVLFFIITMTETILATWWMYDIFKYIGN